MFFFINFYCSLFVACSGIVDVKGIDDVVGASSARHQLLWSELAFRQDMSLVDKYLVVVFKIQIPAFSTTSRSRTSVVGLSSPGFGSFGLVH